MMRRLVFVLPFVLLGCEAAAPTAPVCPATVTHSCPAPERGTCAWEKTIKPSEGYEKRWTSSEKVQLVDHNRKVTEYCK